MSAFNRKIVMGCMSLAVAVMLLVGNVAQAATCNINELPDAVINQQAEMASNMLQRMGDGPGTVDELMDEVYTDIETAEKHDVSPYYVAHPCLVPEAMYMMVTMHQNWERFDSMGNAQTIQFWKDWLVE